MSIGLQNAQLFALAQSGQQRDDETTLRKTVESEITVVSKPS
jgi:hypothetical protein